MSRTVTRAELAARAGVSRPAITKAMRGPLAAALVGDRVDLDHPAVVAYLKGKAKGEPAELAPDQPPVPAVQVVADDAPTKTTKPGRRRVAAPTAPGAPAAARAEVADPAPTPPPHPEGATTEELLEVCEGDIQGAAREDVARLIRALRPIVQRFGTRRGFKDWLVALKDLEEIRKRRLDNEETEGRLISRDLVKTHIFGAIDGSHRRLLSDVPKTASRLLYAMAKTQEPVEVAEQRLRDIISTILKPVKATAARVAEEA